MAKTRTPKMKNVGLHDHRLKFNPDELRFAQQWDDINSVGSYGVRTIDYLISTRDDNRPVTPTKEQRELAATVIQWLGSPVGIEFLRSVGFEKVTKRAPTGK